MKRLATFSAVIGLAAFVACDRGELPDAPQVDLRDGQADDGEEPRGTSDPNAGCCAPTYTCQDSSDCCNGVCKDNVCEEREDTSDGCTSSGDCNDDEECIDNECLTECLSGADCNKGATCETFTPPPGADPDDYPSSVCRKQTCECGDGVVQSANDEECDLGVDEEGNSLNTCENGCINCKSVWCGDGIIQECEECDLGDPNPNDDVKEHADDETCADCVYQCECDEADETTTISKTESFDFTQGCPPPWSGSYGAAFTASSTLKKVRKGCPTCTETVTLDNKADGTLKACIWDLKSSFNIGVEDHKDFCVRCAEDGGKECDEGKYCFTESNHQGSSLTARRLWPYKIKLGSENRSWKNPIGASADVGCEFSLRVAVNANEKEGETSKSGDDACLNGCEECEHEQRSIGVELGGAGTCKAEVGVGKWKMNLAGSSLSADGKLRGDYTWDDKSGEDCEDESCFTDKFTAEAVVKLRFCLGYLGVGWQVDAQGGFRASDTIKECDGVRQPIVNTTEPLHDFKVSAGCTGGLLSDLNLPPLPGDQWSPFVDVEQGS